MSYKPERALTRTIEIWYRPVDLLVEMSYKPERALTQNATILAPSDTDE